MFKRRRDEPDATGPSPAPAPARALFPTAADAGTDSGVGVPRFRPAAPPPQQEAPAMARAPFAPSPNQPPPGQPSGQSSGPSSGPSPGQPQGQMRPPPSSGAPPQPGAQHGAHPGQAPQPQAKPTERRTLVVGRGISLQGVIQDAERLVVEGTVEAQLLHATELVVAPGGIFKGEVEVDDAEIAGTIDGAVAARGNLIVRGTGRVIGTARYRRLQVEDGGQISGRMEMLTDGPGPANG